MAVSGGEVGAETMLKALEKTVNRLDFSLKSPEFRQKPAFARKPCECGG
jgi:hypothetical protein